MILKPYATPRGLAENILPTLIALLDQDLRWPSIAARWMCKSIATCSDKARGSDGSLVFRARVELTAMAILLNTCDDDAHRGWFLQVARCVPGCFEPVA
jgi:hypothetical protein